MLAVFLCLSILWGHCLGIFSEDIAGDISWGHYYGYFLVPGGGGVVIPQSDFICLACFPEFYVDLEIIWGMFLVF